MNSSLDSLVKNLSDNDFKYLSEDKLPDRCKFFSSLKDKCISEKDYLKPNNIWNVFRTNTVGDYYDLYLNTHVLLLVDVFEKIFLVIS